MCLLWSSHEKNAIFCTGLCIDPNGSSREAEIEFPPSLASYADGHIDSIGDMLSHRVKVAPFNLAATLIFLLAIIHTFLTCKFLEISDNGSTNTARK